MNTPNFTDDELNDLLRIIRTFGGCIHTYPGCDENNSKIFAGCLELEKRGLVYRVIEAPAYVLFGVKS